MDKFLTRRQWLGGGAAFAATPVLAAWPSGTVDVAIVGAGAAGIAAARRIAEARRSSVVLAAMGRVGGRAYTPDAGSRVAHHRGAHRLPSPAKNPLIDIAKSERFQVYDPSPSRRLLVGAREARDGEYDDFTSAVRRARRAIVAVGDIGRDVAAGGMLSDVGEWEATVAFVLGPLACAKDLNEVSAIDIARAEERPDDLVVREGVGTALAAAAEGVPVERNSAASTRATASSSGWRQRAARCSRAPSSSPPLPTCSRPTASASSRRFPSAPSTRWRGFRSAPTTAWCSSLPAIRSVLPPTSACCSRPPTGARSLSKAASAAPTWRSPISPAASAASLAMPATPP